MKIVIGHSPALQGSFDFVASRTVANSFTRNLTLLPCIHKAVGPKFPNDFSAHFL